jgi:hypothetical protein
VSSSPSGLLIEGEVDGPKPEFPALRTDLLSKDHVEVWLAAEPALNFPPIGWGNQFGESDLKSENDCPEPGAGNHDRKKEDCKTWFREQIKYREQFKRLFVRQWLLSPGSGYDTDHTVEAYAYPAFQNIAANFFPNLYMPAAIAPVPNDGVGMSVLGTEGNKRTYGFQIGIPYSAFPPVPSLTIRDLWLMVDVFSAAPEGRRMGAFSTTAPRRKWGDPSTFNHVRIEHPLQLSLSPCAYPLAQQDLYGQDQPSFVYPVPVGTKEGARVLIDKAVMISNPVRGYLYDPAGASPEARAVSVFSKPTGNGGFVCGPELAYVKGPVSVRSGIVVAREGFDGKALTDGWTLVKSGPRAGIVAPKFGTGACGACPVAELHVYAISPQGEVKPALQIDELMDGTHASAADFDFWRDWTRATYYSQAADPATLTRGAWTATTYCLKGHTYEACGSKENATPPDPPVVKSLRVRINWP